MMAKTSEILPALLGTFLFLFIIIPFFYIWIPRQILLSPVYILSFDIGIFRYLGLLPIAFGTAICFWCCSSFVFTGKGTPIPFTPTKALIVTGLYRFVRNPLYIAGIFVLVGEAIFLQSIGIFIYFMVMFAAFSIHVLMEETILAENFGAVYEQYRNSALRWIPRFKSYKNSDSD